MYSNVTSYLQFSLLKKVRNWPKIKFRTTIAKTRSFMVHAGKIEEHKMHTVLGGGH